MTKTSVISDSITPLYVQLADLLREKILSGVLEPGTLLPSNEELCKQHGISRVTVRLALKTLAQEGLLVAGRGKGTFVSTPRIGHNLNDVLTWPNIIISPASGYKVKVVGFGKVKANDEVLKFFDLTSGQKMLRIQRQHYVGNFPVAFVNLFVSPVVEAIFTKKIVEELPVYDLVESKTEYVIGRAVQFIRACSADQTIARYLELEVGDPVLMSERRTSSTTGIPIAHSFFYYRADEHEFKIELHRSQHRTLLPSI